MEYYHAAPTSFTRRDGDDGDGRDVYRSRQHSNGSGFAYANTSPSTAAAVPKPITRFIDISSAYRNRLLPNQSVCDFSVPVNAPSRNDPSSALDPVLLAFPFCTNFTSAASTTTSIRLNASSTTVTNYFAGCILEIGGIFVTIKLYRETTQVAEVEPPLPTAPPTGTLYTIRAQRPLHRGTVAASGAGTVTLDAGASSSAATYANAFVFLPGGNPPATYRWAPISAYNPTTREATLGGGGIVCAVGEIVEILAFTRDNVVPLVYTAQEPTGAAAGPSSSLSGAGSGAGNGAGAGAGNRPPMFRLKLSDFILPNLPVGNGYHGRLSDYSHVYVAISNDQGATFSNVLLSNSPFSSQALWKVPMSQFSTNMPFLYFDGGDVEQVVRFKPDQNLRVTVWLPNGQVLAFKEESPTFFFPGLHFPIDNNPFAQISLTVGITRV